MNDKENLHNGHRSRAIEKLISASSVLNDHELLEILLFAFLPRVDTNPIAHRLLKMFGSLEGVFSASPEQLLAVKGIGKKTAGNIHLLGLVLKRVNIKKDKPIKNSFDAIKQELIELFYGETTEKSVILLFDHKFIKLTTLSFEDKQKSSVSCDVPEIVTAFALHKPTYALLAHNHLSGIVSPSEQDDFTTKKICLLCDLNGVNLIDHVIVSKNNAFSYRTDGRLDYIKEKAKLNNLIEYLK